jgi:hypothetical protein
MSVGLVEEELDLSGGADRIRYRRGRGTNGVGTHAEVVMRYSRSWQAKVRLTRDQKEE